MQEKNSNILIKIFWQFAIVLGIGMSAYSDPADQFHSDQRIATVQNQEFDVEASQFLAEDHNHIPFHNSPAEESSSNEENLEEENEETNDSEYDGILSHYQVGNLSNPFNNIVAFVNNSINYGSYNIPLYVLFHCWKSFIS